MIAFSAETNILKTGDILFRAGENADCGFFVVSGSFLLEGRAVSQHSSKIVGPHTLIGEAALITEAVRPVTVTAQEPSTVLRISRSLFKRVLNEFPDSAAKAAILIAQRLRLLAQELAKLETR